MRTRKTGREDIPALKALWQEAFGDEQQDIDLFFETVYPNATGFCAEDGGELVSMLFALPQTIVKEEKQLKCAYLYAVATLKAVLLITSTFFTDIDCKAVHFPNAE